MSMPKPFELVPSMVDSAGSVDSGNMGAKSNGCRIVCFVALGTPKTGSKNRPIFVHKCGFGPFWVLERASTRFAVRMTKVSCKSFFRTNRCIFVSGGEVRKISVFGRVVLGESFCVIPWFLVPFDSRLFRGFVSGMGSNFAKYKKCSTAEPFFVIRVDSGRSTSEFTR